MIVLFGHGYVADNIAKELHKQSFVFVRLSHHALVPKEAKFIINAAGFTGNPNVDACEVLRDECVDGNILWPLRLEKSTDLPILHISSGCVYTGYEKQWTEEDKPNFTFNNASFYSACKALAQELLSEHLKQSYLFRIRMPFGSYIHHKNLLTKYERYAKLIDYENSVTQVEDLAKCVCHFIRTKPSYGIYNVCNPGSTSTKKIVEEMGLVRVLAHPKKEWMTEAEFASAVIAPRSNCVLNTKKLENVYDMRPVDQAVSETVRTYLSRSLYMTV